MSKHLDLIQTNRSKKYEGASHNKINILKYIGSNPKNKVAIYECKCSLCNNIFTSLSSNFTEHKYLKGCKSCTDKASGISRTVHGFSKSHKTYISWRKIKERCFNVHSKDYKDYGARGITMQQSFVDDFIKFYEEVGEPPENNKTWSIDRIDPNKGYIQGNLRWANTLQQARNKRKSSVNTSGATGVQWYEQQYSTKTAVKSILYAVSTWSEYIEGKRMTLNKKFCVSKYGLLPAFAMAFKYRMDKIDYLNQQGCDYGKQHGL